MLKAANETEGEGRQENDDAEENEPLVDTVSVNSEPDQAPLHLFAIDEKVELVLLKFYNITVHNSKIFVLQGQMAALFFNRGLTKNKN
jgi:hypothetical protein